MSGASVVAFRLVHVLSGALWVGFAVFVAIFLIPSIRAIGPAGGPMMQQIGQVRRLPAFILALALLTVFSGLGLYWHDSAGFSSKAWLGSGTGMAFGAGGAFAIITVILGMTVNSPTGKRMGMLAGEMQQAGGPPASEKIAEMQRLQARMGKASVVAAALLVGAAALMAIARYMS